MLDYILLHCQNSATLESAHALLHTLMTSFPLSLGSDSSGTLMSILGDMGFRGLWRMCSRDSTWEPGQRCIALTERLIEVAFPVRRVGPYANQGTAHNYIRYYTVRYAIGYWDTSPGARVYSLEVEPSGAQSMGYLLVVAYRTMGVLAGTGRSSELVPLIWQFDQWVQLEEIRGLYAHVGFSPFDLLVTSPICCLHFNTLISPVLTWHSAFLKH